MKSKLLLPHGYGKWGVILFVPTFILGIFFLATGFELAFLSFNVPAIVSHEFLEDLEFFTFVENNIADEIISIILIVSLIFIGFSRDKDEDEMIMQIRLKSLSLSLFINYSVLLLSLLFVYGLSFYWVMIFNLFSILLLYCLIYKYKIVRLKKSF